MKDCCAATLLFVGIACVSWNQHPAMSMEAGDGPSTELTVRYHDGGLYRGLFLGGKRNGRGVMDYPDGTRYRGEWKNDQRHGAGEILLPDGSRYTGIYTCDSPEGAGVYINSWGEKMRVVYASGRLVSRTSISFAPVRKLCRYGTVHILDGKYTGWYQGNRMHGYRQHGRGKIRWQDGSFYSGQWKNGKMHGRGVMSWEDGSSYAGQWKHGKREGRGSYRWVSGSRYTGEWMDNQKHGSGTMYCSDGRVLAGRFENDTFVEEKLVSGTISHASRQVNTRLE